MLCVISSYSYQTKVLKKVSVKVGKDLAWIYIFIFGKEVGFFKYRKQNNPKEWLLGMSKEEEWGGRGRRGGEEETLTRCLIQRK